MKLTNQVYNGDFLLAQETNPAFPDGWIKTGGDKDTTWDWIGSTTRSLAIHHPSGPRAGIGQGIEVTMPAGEVQRWEARVTLHAVPAGVTCYLRVFLGSISQQLFTLYPGAIPELFSRVFTTPPGTTGIRLEVGILGVGDIVIHEIQAFRLFPLRELRLDDKGQVFVRRVDSVGEIQKPIAARIVGPVPLPVEVKNMVVIDFRSLNPARDGVTVYGSGGIPLRQGVDGFLEVQVAGNRYSELKVDVIADPVIANTAPLDVSGFKVYTFGVINNSSDNALARIDLSPDALTWTTDVQAQVLPGTLHLLTPIYFTRYARVSYQSLGPGPIPLIIWFQAQA